MNETQGREVERIVIATTHSFLDIISKLESLRNTTANNNNADHSASYITAAAVVFLICLKILTITMRFNSKCVSEEIIMSPTLKTHSIYI